MTEPAQKFSTDTANLLESKIRALLCSVIPRTNKPAVVTADIMNSKCSAAEMFTQITPENMDFTFEAWMKEMNRISIRRHVHSKEQKHV